MSIRRAIACSCRAHVSTTNVFDHDFDRPSGTGALCIAIQALRAWLLSDCSSGTKVKALGLAWPSPGPPSINCISANFLDLRSHRCSRGSQWQKSRTRMSSRAITIEERLRATRNGTTRIRFSLPRTFKNPFSFFRSSIVIVLELDLVLGIRGVGWTSS
jgi:hypothetical protein